MSKVTIEIDTKTLRKAILSLPKNILEEFMEDINEGKNIKKDFSSPGRGNKKQVLKTLETISIWSKNDIKQIEKAREEINKRY